MMKPLQPDRDVAATATGDPRPPGRRMPLYLRVLVGAVLGSLLGIAFGTEPYLLGSSNKDLGQLGILVIRLLKALAAPLILFAILDAFAKTRLAARDGGRLVFICLVNMSVALTIGLLIMNIFHPGSAWEGKLNWLSGALHADDPAFAQGDATLNPLKNLAGYIPESLLEPFLRNNIITIVLAGLLGGAALRRLKDREGDSPGVATMEQFVETSFKLLVQMLEWVVQAIPFAVFAMVAQVVGSAGIEVFQLLAVFLATILAGLGIHALIYYPLIAWLAARRTPAEYFGGGADAIITGLSCNSSLATVPVTMKCLTRNLGVSETSARLSTCVGTNLNNDGITLYEAMAALFLAQAIGMDLSLGQQLGVVLASVMAAVGVAGVPEAGLIVLPLVLGASGLPEAVVATAIPLILPVDWIIARCRSGVNVMSDLLVGILLEATDPARPTRDTMVPATEETYLPGAPAAEPVAVRAAREGSFPEPVLEAAPSTLPAPSPPS